jgi:aryl sulfotransferase
MSALRRYRSPVEDSGRWDGFVFRPDDIVISTPAKCGTTWTQMICALLIFQTPDFEPSLDLISPWLDMQTRSVDAVVADLEAQTHRRFIKTHTPLDGLPYDERVTYICVGRDPRDVALSWDHHVSNTDLVKLFTARDSAVGNDDLGDFFVDGIPERPESEADRFWHFVDDEHPIEEWTNLASTLHHLQTFWDVRDRPNVVMLHYDDLRRDLEGQMRALAARLAIDVPEDRWPTLVEAAGFESMKSNADRVTPDATNAIFVDNEQFFRAGTSRQWERILTNDADMERYFTRVNALASPELIAWVHQKGG